MKPVIFFDWDGTLADSMNLCVAEIRQALITMRLPDLPDDVLRQCNGPTFEQSLDILHIPHDRAQEYMTTRLTAELALVPTVNRLFPGVREMLQTLRQQREGARQAVVQGAGRHRHHRREPDGRRRG